MYSQMCYIVIYSLWAGFNKKPSKRKPKFGIAPTLARAGEPPFGPSQSVRPPPYRRRLRPRRPDPASAPPPPALRPPPSAPAPASGSGDRLPSSPTSAGPQPTGEVVLRGGGAAASRDIQGRRVRSAPAPARQRPSGLRRRVLLRKPAAQQGKMIAGLPWGRPAEGMTNSISSHPVLIISEFVGSGASS